jgi:hypothetical protein
VVFILFVLIFVLTYIFQKKAKVHRLKRREINISITSRFVKILMAKFEILQNDKIDNELKYIKTNLDKNVLLNYRINNYNIITDLLVRILVDGSKIAIIVIF